MKLTCENVLMWVMILIGAWIVMTICRDGNLDNLIPTMEPFAVVGSEGVSNDASFKEVSGLGRTPSTCYPQPELKAEDLLPKEDSKAIQEFNIAKPAGEGILSGINLLDAGFHVGVNTVGQSLKNANRQLRAEPPNPQVNVSPWMNTTIGPDLLRKPLEDGGCGTSSSSESQPAPVAAAA